MTRVFESNGPDIKIRGTASHIAEKYVQLARDARSSGDPVAAENYYQHAEHYFRLIAAAQEQFRQNQPQQQPQPMVRTDLDMADELGDDYSSFGAEPGFAPSAPQPHHAPREAQQPYPPREQPQPREQAYREQRPQSQPQPPRATRWTDCRPSSPAARSRSRPAATRAANGRAASASAIAAGAAGSRAGQPGGGAAERGFRSGRRLSVQRTAGTCRRAASASVSAPRPAASPE